MVLQTQFAQIRDRSLYIDDVDAMDLVKKYGTPLYVMSEGHIRHQLNELKTKFLDKYDHVLPLFASKSFSCLEIYRITSEYGIGIDCVSAGEISIALKAGFDPHKIYFHGNNKLPSEIDYAIAHDVDHFVIDNFYEIELVEKYAKKYDKTIYATVRVVPEIKAGGHGYIQTGHKDTKFGFSARNGIYLKAIQQIVDSSHIEFEGIHCHIGSQVFDLYAYISAMHRFVRFAYEIYDQLGVRGWDMPMVLVEPGRYVVGNAGITLYTVGSVKDIPDVRTYMSVDGGMTDNIRTALYDAQYDGIIVNKAYERRDTKVTVAGKICESADIVVKEIMLPYPEPGDIFAQFSTGAYHYSMSSNYNQLPKPAVVFTYQGKSKLVIRRQTFDDLVAFDVQEDYQ